MFVKNNNNSAISIITITARPKGVELVYSALKRQQFDMSKVEWIIGTPYPKKLNLEIIKNSTIIKDPRRIGVFWNVNYQYNRCIEKARGELLISIQDYTYFCFNALAKFWQHYQNNKKAIVSGVGDKYTDETWTVKVWADPRQRDDQGSFYETDFCNIEGNFCAIPKQAIYDVGGFDAEADFLGVGMDWYGVLERIFDFGGYQFFLDQTNKSYSLPHDRLEGWDEHNLINGGYMARKKELVDKKVYPVLSFLQNDTKPS